jgi:hypothetical protein
VTQEIAPEVAKSSFRFSPNLRLFFSYGYFADLGIRAFVLIPKRRWTELQAPSFARRVA